MNNLIRIKDYVIRRGFPELKEVEIDIYYKNLDEGFLRCSRDGRFEYSIEVNKSLMYIDPIIITGGIAHEIGHVSKGVQMNYLMSFIDETLYDLSKMYRNNDERWTDLKAIERGFCEELLIFKTYTNKFRKEPAGYLTQRELEEIVMNPR